MTDIESPEPAATADAAPAATADAAPAATADAVPAATAPETATPDAVPPAAAKPRRTALKAAAAVVAAALLGVGIGEAIIKVHYGDAPAPVAAAPAPSGSPAAQQPWGAKSNGNHFGSLRDLLLPVPGGYRLGPDYKSIGNDHELRDQDLQKALKETLADIPEKYRKDAESVLSALHIQGIGARSLVTTDNRTMVTLVLSQYNQQAVAAENNSYGKWYTDNELYRVGPGVVGHTEAHCALPMLKAGDELDYLECYAGVGDLLVQMEVAGVAPLDQNKVVDLFRQQLDRLATPGATA